MINFLRPASLGFASFALLLGSHVVRANPASNLINPNGWTLYDGGANILSRSVVGAAHVQDGALDFSDSGGFGLFDGQPGIVVPYFVQPIATVPGQSYTFQFDVSSDGYTPFDSGIEGFGYGNRLYFEAAAYYPQDLSYLYDNMPEPSLFSAKNIPAEYNVPYSFTAIATSGTMYVTFAGGAPITSLSVSNISATPVSSAAVPEASTPALLGLGTSYLAILLLRARKRNQHSQTA